MGEHLSCGTAVYRIRVAPENVGLFRFLLEAYGHIGYFSVIERSSALLKFVTPEACENAARRVLNEIAQTMVISVEPWPFPA